MRAAVQVGASAFEVQELEGSPREDREILVEVVASGVCGSDVPWFEEAPPEPRVLGHEIVVQVPRDEVPDYLGDRGVEPGELLVLEEYLPCLDCRQCAESRWRFCPVVDPWTGFSRYGLKPLSDSAGLWGGYGTHVVMSPRTRWHRAGSDRDLAVRLSFALPLANGFEWTSTAAPVTRLAVIGAGQQGAAAAVAATLNGVEDVSLLARDASDGILDLLGSLDVRVHHIDTDEQTDDVVAALEDTCDVVLAAVPSNPDVVANALRLASRGGSIRFAGKGFESHLPSGSLTAKGLEVRAVRGHSDPSVERAVETLRGQDLAVIEDHIDRFDGLDRAARAVESVAEGRNGNIHTVVVP